MDSKPNQVNDVKLKWTLGRKIGGLAVVLLALLVITTGYAIYAFNKIGHELKEIAEMDLPLIHHFTEAAAGQLHQHIALERSHAAGSDETKRQQALEQFDKSSRRVGSELSKAANRIRNATDYSAGAMVQYRAILNKTKQLESDHQEFEQHARLLIAGQGSATGEQVEREASEFDRKMEELLAQVETLTEDSALAAEKHERAAVWTMVLLQLIALGCGATISVILVRRIRADALMVSERAMAVAQGDLTVESIPVRTTDEMGQLAVAFNRMLESLRVQTGETRAALTSLGSAATQILAATKEQASTTQEQAAAVQEITSTVEEVHQSGAEIAERARNVSLAGENAASASEAGLRAVDEANHSMDAIRGQVEDVAENIVTLSEKTQAVGEIIAAVNDIAEQSNLLALNASIEAVAAGDQGSRFSVVANEIKNLAEQAKEATSQVRTILSDIQKGINTSVMLTEEAVKRADSGKSKTEISSQSIQELATTTRESVQTFDQIIAGTNQQKIGFEQVTRGMHDIRQAADQTAVGTTQLERAVVDLNSLGEQLRGIVDHYRL